MVATGCCGSCGDIALTAIVLLVSFGVAVISNLVGDLSLIIGRAVESTSVCFLRVFCLLPCCLCVFVVLVFFVQQFGPYLFLENDVLFLSFVRVRVRDSCLSIYLCASACARAGVTTPPQA